jgi:threonine aldolase
MPLSPQEREALRRTCKLVVAGHPEPPPGEELIAVGEWCRAHGYPSDRYADGKLIGEFETKIAALLGKEASAFMVSGTMAQQIALRIHADRSGTPSFAMHTTAHLELHELRAYSRVQRLDATLMGPRERPILAADLADCSDRLSALLVELPAREIGGQLPTWDQLVELSELARKRGVKMHLDGARLWEAREAYAPRTYADICALFDSVYVSFYKGIGALAGAMLLGAADFMSEARAWRKRMGGTLVAMHPYVASAAMRFDAQLAKMPAYRARALALADALATVPGIRLLPSPPQVNMFHVCLPLPPDALAAARDRIAQEEGAWIANRFGASSIPGWSYLELYVGDNLMPLSDGQVAGLFARLLSNAQTAR